MCAHACFALFRPPGLRTTNKSPSNNFSKQERKVRASLYLQMEKPRHRAALGNWLRLPQETEVMPEDSCTWVPAQPALPTPLGAEPYQRLS